MHRRVSKAQSLTNRLWEGLSAHVYVFLHQTRLSDVIENELSPCPAVPNLFEVVDEGSEVGRWLTGMYLDWNATAPLRDEAQAAMIAAMDVVGNPSSVHGEGRAAKSVVEKARAQVAAAVGCDVAEVVFTSGATEAAAIGGLPEARGVRAGHEHEALGACRIERGCSGHVLAMGLANGETGVNAASVAGDGRFPFGAASRIGWYWMLRRRLAGVPFAFNWSRADFAIFRPISWAGQRALAR